MTEHTKEPWHLSQDGQHILSRTGELSFAHVAEVFHKLDDARRIVACVNVCAGISTEALEGGTAPVLTADVARDAERYRACNGSNCGCTDGISHSDDCISEHDAIVDEAALVDHVEHGGWKCFGCGYDGQDNQRYNRICARCGVHR